MKEEFYIGQELSTYHGKVTVTSIEDGVVYHTPDLIGATHGNFYINKMKTITFKSGRTLEITEDEHKLICIRLLNGANTFQLFQESIEQPNYLVINISEIETIK